jgi:hypothetical protein
MEPLTELKSYQKVSEKGKGKIQIITAIHVDWKMYIIWAYAIDQ